MNIFSVNVYIESLITVTRPYLFFVVTVGGACVCG
jgi:hypothetical protein